MLKTIFYIILGWFLYKLIFDFIIPVYRGTKQVRRQMRDMQDAMRQQYEQQNQQQAPQQAPPRPKETVKRDEGDYIDFEEIKN